MNIKWGLFPYAKFKRYFKIVVHCVNDRKVPNVG